MKVYVHDKGIILVGKGWEVLQKLKEYNKDYLYLFPNGFKRLTQNNVLRFVVCPFLY